MHNTTKNRCRTAVSISLFVLLLIGSSKIQSTESIKVVNCYTTGPATTFIIPIKRNTSNRCHLPPFSNILLQTEDYLHEQKRLGVTKQSFHSNDKKCTRRGTQVLNTSSSSSYNDTGSARGAHKNIYVAGLKPNCTEQELDQEFNKYGSISLISLIQTRVDPSKTFAFITYDSEQVADHVLSIRNEILQEHDAFAKSNNMTPLYSVVEAANQMAPRCPKYIKLAIKEQNIILNILQEGKENEHSSNSGDL